MRRVWYYYLYLLIAWGSFRYFVRLPNVIEELWFKPLLWLVPLFWWGLSISPKLVMFGKRWFRSITIGIFVGIIYFLLVKRFNFEGMVWDWNIVGVALATAVTEELTFSGFVAGYLERVNKGKGINYLIVGLMVAVIRLPILLFVYRLGLIDITGVVLFAGASGAINGWIRVKTENVTGSVLARLGMNLAILG